jgi:hypothetical protein
MASTYTTNLGIEKPGTGEQAGTWGTTVNLNYDIIDTSISGQLTLTLGATGSTGSPNTLPVSDGAVSNGQNAFIDVTDGGDLGGNVYLQLTPNDAERIIWFKNSLSGSRDLYIFQGTYNASNDHVLAAGDSVLLRFDGGGAGAVATSVSAPVDSIAGITGTKSEFDTACIDGSFVYNGDTIGELTGTKSQFDTACSNGNFVYTDTAALTNVTSLGTLTALQVDNINIKGNTISSTAGTDLNINPLAGQQIVLDSTIVVDAGVVTGATSISSTAFVGTLSTAAQPNVTSLGTLTTLTVDNITVNGAAITSGTGAISFSNENLSTTGTLAAGATTITGAITATGDITAFFTSDMALKQNIEPITGALDKVMALAGSRYEYRNKPEKKGAFYGLMAQDVQKVLPELVHENADGELTIRMAGFELVAVLVEAIKELKEKIDGYTQ